MLLKKIKIQNIRSYKEHEIEFTSGSTLLAGDIGSGKTSILLAIEFALFGLQPGQRGSSILRNGQEEGKVIMDFSVEGKEITIERTLKRKKTITQDYCSITVDGEKKELSVTELKSLVLNLLNYPAEFSKKQNLLYKFTVYTPQEEMKQIILQDSATRINTLRHVFGIDKYKRILENVAIITVKLREEKRIKELITMDLEKEKQNLNSKQGELILKDDSLIEIQKELFIKKEKIKEIEQRKKEIQDKIEEKLHFQKEIEKTNLMIASKKETIASNIKLIEAIKDQIEELQKLNFDNNIIKDLEQKISKLKLEKENLDEINTKITVQISSLGIKNQENENIKEKLTSIEVCPTCLQDVNTNYKNNVVNKLNSNTETNVKKIEELAKNKKQTVEKIQNTNLEITENQNQIQKLNILKVKLENLEEKQTRLKEIEKSNELLKKDIDLLNQHLDVLKSSIFELNKFENIAQENKQQLIDATRQERMSEIKIAELNKEIDLFKREIQELKEKIQKKQEIKDELNYISELESWLSKQFVPVISEIEKNVMIKLKHDFSELFSEWFTTLVSDTFNVKLSDDFTPIIEQQDYEIDYAYLSGGERTAIALAYRLALNQVINSMLSKIKTKNLVILDEPTDGFSEQQLDKMRDILDQLSVEQLIIVSHEQKIEDFVENIIRLKKENNVSLIQE